MFPEHHFFCSVSTLICLKGFVSIGKFGLIHGMDKTNKSENSIKGVRLQGFKGFKLKNTQILFKPNFANKTKSSEKKSSNSLIASNVSPIKLSTHPVTAGSTVTDNIHNNNQSNNLERTKTFSSVLQDEIEKKVTNNNGLLSVSKENLPTSSSVALKSENWKVDIDNGSTSTQVKSSNDLQALQSPTKLKSHLKSSKEADSQSSHISSRRNYSVKSHGLRLESQMSLHDQHDPRSNRHHGRDKYHSRSHDNYHSHSHESHRRSRSRDRYSSESSKKSRELNRKHRNVPVSQKQKRRHSSTSSESTDDDEVMRRMRERRKSSHKSSETYSPRKKMRENEILPVPSLLNPNLVEEENLQNKEIKKENVFVNANTMKEEKEVPVLKSNAVVPLASIGCWLGEEEEVEEIGNDEKDHQECDENYEKRLEKNDSAIQRFDTVEEKDDNEQRNCFDVFLSTTEEDVTENIEKSDSENALCQENTPLLELRTSIHIESSLKVDKPIPSKPKVAENAAELNEFTENKTDVVDVGKSKLPEQYLLHEAASPISCNEIQASTESSSPENLNDQQSSIRLENNDKSSCASEKCSVQERHKRDEDENIALSTHPESSAAHPIDLPSAESSDELTVVIRSVETSMNTVIAPTADVGTVLPEKRSSEQLKAIHPAKKRYREWMRSISMQENDSVKPSPEVASINAVPPPPPAAPHSLSSAVVNTSTLPSYKEETIEINLPLSNLDCLDASESVAPLPDGNLDSSSKLHDKAEDSSNSEMPPSPTNSISLMHNEDILEAKVDAICPLSPSDKVLRKNISQTDLDRSELIKETSSSSTSKQTILCDQNSEDASTTITSFPRKLSTDGSCDVVNDHKISLSNTSSVKSTNEQSPDIPESDDRKQSNENDFPSFTISYTGIESPVINYSLSDDQSSISDLQALSPIDIRIPIDNDIEEEKPESNMEVGDTWNADDFCGEELEHVQDPSVDMVSDVFDSAVDDSTGEGGRRRSSRLKTRVKKKPTFLKSNSDEKVEDSFQVNDATDQYEMKKDGSSGSSIISRQTSLEVKPVEMKTPPTFEMIEENVYLFQKRKSRARKEIRRMLCECITTTEEGKPPCGENCLNRLLMIECSARCPFGELCTNKRFQRREYMKTEVFETSWKGLGLRASEDLSPGKLVMEYCGEVLDPYEFFRRSQYYAEHNQQHFYFMALSQDEIIDATYKGNNSRFINHSCDPNCETQKWTVNGRLRVGFVAVRNVSAGEEITFDYQFERYGKEAQKCYCGSSNCRGYLGKPPSDEDTAVLPVCYQLDPASYQAEKERKPRYKVERFQEFKENSLESEILRLNNGMQTTKEVLLLSRLMVRCDTIKERMMCLNVIRKTNNTASLRAFLHFHGLPLIWSWMVDVTGNLSSYASNNSDQVLKLKVEILSTLAILPINNRNILEDSKVLSMVKRWTEETCHANTNEEKCDERSDDGKPAVEEEITADGKDDQGEGSELKGDCKEWKEIEEKVLSLASRLLDSWKDLKEIYRIPKRQRPSEGDITPQSNRPDGDDKPKVQSPPSSAPSSRSHSRSRDEREKSPRSRSSHRDKDGRHRDADREKRHRRSPVKMRSKDEDAMKSSKLHDTGNKYAWLESGGGSRLSRQEHRRQFERDMKHKDEKKSEVKQMINKEGIVSPLPLATTTTVANTPSVTSSITQSENDGFNVSSALSTALDTATFTPSGYSGNLIQINPAPVTPSSIVYTNTHVQVQPQISYVAVHPSAQPPVTSILQSHYLTSQPTQGQPISVIGAPPSAPQVLPPPQGSLLGNPYASLQQSLASTLPPQQVTLPPVNTSGVTVLGYYGNNAIVLLSPEQLKELTDLLAFKSLQQATVQPTMICQPPLPQPAAMQVQLPPTIPPQPTTNLPKPAAVIQSQPPAATTTPQQPTATIQPQPPGIPLVVPEQPVLVAARAATPVAKVAPTQISVTSHPVRVVENETPSETSSNPITLNSPPKDPRPPRLPPNWKTACDADGCIYYYHVITRQTQWDPPTWDASAEELMEKKEEDMDISSPGPEDIVKTVPEKSATEKMAATAVIASDTEQAKKAKESFRSRMSQHIVTCLSSYRKSDCKVGRIVTNEDFKKLARKLTYNVLMKEIKQVQVWEDLECNANVKHKAKEYVRKYMARMGPVYKGKEDDNTR